MSAKKSDLTFYLVVAAVLVASLGTVLATKTDLLTAYGDSRDNRASLVGSDMIIIYSLSEWVTPVLENRIEAPGGIEGHIEAGAEALEWLGDNGYLVLDESVLKVPAKGRYLTPDLYASIRAEATADE